MRWHWNDWGLAALGVLALLALSPVGQVLAVVGLISIIGMPIAFLILALPSIFLVAAACRLAWGAWSSFRRGKAAAALSLGLALLAMTDVFVFRAWRVNHWLEERAADFAAGDLDKLVPVSRVDTLAIVPLDRMGRDAADGCDDLCRRLLLTGAAAKVVTIALPPAGTAQKSTEAEAQTFEPSPALSGWSWHLERRERCDDPGPLVTRSPVQLPDRQQRKGLALPPVSSEQLLRLAIAGGTCLAREPATLAEADVVLAYGEVQRPQSTFAAGYDAWTNTVGAWRIAFWVRHDQRFDLAYRRTGIAWQRLPGVFIPWLENGPELRTAAGWARIIRYLHRTPAEPEAPLGAFVTERLGLDLRPSPSAAGESQDPGPQAALRREQAKAVDRILAGEGAPTGIERTVIDDYFDSLGSPFSRRANGAGPADAARVLQVVESPRLELPGDAVGAVRFAVETDAGLSRAFARALAMRLERLPSAPAGNSAREVWNARVRAITASLATLPAEALQPYTALAAALTRNREQRAVATTFLAHLDVFGPPIVPDILAMMDEVFTLREGKPRDDPFLRHTWSEVWRAGALSLCRMGPQIPREADSLRDRVRILLANRITMANGVVAAALLRMGASEESIRDTLAVNAADAAAMRQFESTLRRARRDDACR